MKIKKDYWTKADAVRNGRLDVKGIMVHSTATPGVTAQEFRDRWNRPGVGASVHAFLDDREIVQCMPWDPGEARWAGHCGGDANWTHLSFEICEPAGFYYSGGANMAGYDVAAQAPYFAKVWEQAVGLCAYLCALHGLDPQGDGVLICHSEGHARGVASGHADVMHWFPKHGKNMEMFRREVKERMEDEGMTQEKFNAMMCASFQSMEVQKAFRDALVGAMDVTGTGDTPDPYAAEAAAWAKAEKIFRGDGDGNYGWKLPIKRQDVAQVLFNMEAL